MELSVSNGGELSKLSSKQKERYNYFLPFYGEEALEVVKLISAKGENSFPSIQRKLNVSLHSSYREKEYNNALYEAFEMWNVYSPESIIQEVSQVRSSLGLEPYVNVKASSLSDFLNLFFIERVYEDDKKRNLNGYKPVFRVRPE